MDTAPAPRPGRQPQVSPLLLGPGTQCAPVCCSHPPLRTPLRSASSCYVSLVLNPRAVYPRHGVRHFSDSVSQNFRVIILADQNYLVKFSNSSLFFSISPYFCELLINTVSFANQSLQNEGTPFSDMCSEKQPTSIWSTQGLVCWNEYCFVVC